MSEISPMWKSFAALPRSINGHCHEPFARSAERRPAVISDICGSARSSGCSRRREEPSPKLRCDLAFASSEGLACYTAMPLGSVHHRPGNARGWSLCCRTCTTMFRIPSTRERNPHREDDRLHLSMPEHGHARAKLGNRCGRRGHCREYVHNNAVSHLLANWWLACTIMPDASPRSAIVTSYQRRARRDISGTAPPPLPPPSA